MAATLTGTILDHTAARRPVVGRIRLTAHTPTVRDSRDPDVVQHQRTIEVDLDDGDTAWYAELVVRNRPVEAREWAPVDEQTDKWTSLPIALSEPGTTPAVLDPALLAEAVSTYLAANPPAGTTWIDHGDGTATLTTTSTGGTNG